MSFKAVFADVGQGDSTLLELPDGRFMLVDVYRCPGNGIDLFKLLDDVLPDGDDGKKRLEHLVITHAQDLAGGPVATVTLPQRVPFGFHGNWVPTST